MKAILISIKPKWVAKILNGEKTIEIRKTISKCDLPIDVYIYCSKGQPMIIKHYDETTNQFYNGKVVARFTLNKVHSFYYFDKDLLALACISQEEALKYMGKNEGYAWQIDDLEIFDKPKELSEFKSYKKNIVNTKINGMVFETELDNSLTKAPQNYCYVEVVDRIVHLIDEAQRKNEYEEERNGK